MEALNIYSDLYKKNTALRAIMQMIPCGSALDVVISDGITAMENKRRKAFFKALENGHISLTKEIIESEDFIHCFCITHNAVIKTRKEEKIQFFARMLQKLAENKTFTDIDDYEEILNTIQELSFREIMLLIILHSYETKYPCERVNNGPDHASLYWENSRKKPQHCVCLMNLTHS